MQSKISKKNRLLSYFWRYIVLCMVLVNISCTVQSTKKDTGVEDTAAQTEKVKKITKVKKNTTYAKPAKKLKIPTDKSLGFFVASREETLAHVKRVGIKVGYIPQQFKTREELIPTLYELLSKKLVAAGYEVVTPEVYTATYEKLNLQLGGIYHPDTGAYLQERAEVIRAAAQREFIEKEKLDAIVNISIKEEKAPFYGSKAFLDGAVEGSLGDVPPNALTEFLIGSPNVSGTLTGYSVIVQLLNRQDKVIYGRFGGIELSSYYNPNNGRDVSGFLPVPVENALRDMQRIDRGIALAVLPLTQTPEEIARNEKNKMLNPALIMPNDLPQPAVARVFKKESPLKVSRDEILAKSNKVIVIPVNFKEIKRADIGETFIKFIDTELGTLPWKIIYGENVYDTIAKEIDNAKGLFDPVTGKYDEEKVKEIRKKALSVLPLDSSTVILFSYINLKQAPHINGDAKWDGTNQNIYTLDRVKKRGFFDSAGRNNEGFVRVSTLVVQLRDSQDNLLYQDQGGIELVEQYKNGAPLALTPEELFLSSERNQAAVHVALRSLVKNEQELQLELEASEHHRKRKVRQARKRH